MSMSQAEKYTVDIASRRQEMFRALEEMPIEKWAKLEAIHKMNLDPDATLDDILLAIRKENGLYSQR